MSAGPRLCLFGAADDTGNLGVSALLHSTLDGIATRLPDSDVVVFDHSPGLRHREIHVSGDQFQYRAHGARFSRRVWRTDTFRTLATAARLGGLGLPGARALATADAVLDVGGGDSFSDIYGWRRFRSVVAPRVAAQRLKRPLVLLPQTYGPFEDGRARAIAASVVRDVDLAWARDEESFAVLQDLAGPAFDPNRHRLGVDLAFGLRARRPTGLSEHLQSWLARTDDRPLVGINVSGLVYSRASAARYGLRADYQVVVERLVRKLLDESPARIVLIPHVRGFGGAESDEQAAVDLAGRVAATAQDRVAITPFDLDARQTKWFIGQLDWFCGTRMHSTIAALSQQIPTAAIAYSMKTRGVFDTCGQVACVADARHLTADEIVATVWQTFVERAMVRDELRQSLPAVLTRSSVQLDSLARFLNDRQEGRGSLPRPRTHR